MRVNLRLIELFRTVYDCGSVTEAANRLHITQPAVSKSLNQLEAELGVRLFSRIHGGLRPTRDGERLFSESCWFFAQVAKFQDALLDLSEGRTGLLTVGAIPSLAASILVASVSKLMISRPLAKIHINACQASVVLQDTAHHRIDFGLVHLPMSDHGMDSCLIGESEVIAVVPKGHALARREFLTPSDLSNVPLIMLDAGSTPSHYIRQAFIEANATLKTVMEVNSSSIACSAVTDQVAITLIDPYAAITARPANAVLLPFRPRLPLPIYIVRSLLRPPTSLALALIDEMCSHVETLAEISPFVRAFPFTPDEDDPRRRPQALARAHSDATPAYSADTA